ncbi:hypothetical protein NQZ68_023056 [Dissostichus eleginoides]|nr:hypothetical protein NQZ68_023056 [Dissostichus eleginoides]
MALMSAREGLWAKYGLQPCYMQVSQEIQVCLISCDDYGLNYMHSEAKKTQHKIHAVSDSEWISEPRAGKTRVSGIIEVALPFTAVSEVGAAPRGALPTHLIELLPIERADTDCV